MLKKVTLAAVFSLLTTPGAAVADEIPAGTVLHVRLRQLLSSFGSKPDSRISASLIGPVVIDGRVLLPLNAEILGHVERVRRVGLGLSREKASIDLTFDTLRLPDGSEIAIDARVSEVDNSRETVDRNGRIHGIRATATFASILSGAAVSAGAMDPMLLAFTTSSSLAIFRIPESEVILPAGTELRLRLVETVTVSRDHGPPAAPLYLSPSEERTSALARYVRGLPFRTATDKTNLPSDITNLLFLGERDAVARAFDAAGWGATDPLSSKSTYATLRAIVENQGYREAPMSTLLLNGSPPAFTYAKTLNTFFKRHHVRIFGSLGTYDGVSVWTSSSTHDSGIGFATRAKAFIHVIDQNIDEERDKVVHDMILTGCVDGLSYVDRPWVPRDASNATGDALLTDGRIAVMRLNACTAPIRADAEQSAGPAVRALPSPPERVLRNTTLWLKNDAYRGNIVYQSYSAAHLGFSALFGKREPSPERSFHYGGEEFKIVPGAAASSHPLAPDDPTDDQPSFHPASTVPKSRASFLEFTVSAGYSGFGNDAFSTQNVDVVRPAGVLPETRLPAAFVGELRPRSGFTVKTTMNTSDRVSHEIGYTYNRTLFAATLTGSSDPSEITAATQVRQFNYNVLIHARPNGSRVRPYAAIGPGLQVIRVSEALEGFGRTLRVPFRAVRLIEGAWDLGRKPALEGGGIFQVALQYGAGVKLYASPRWVVLADFRETLSKQPDFWTESYPTLRAASEPGGITFEPRSLALHGPLRHRLFSLGFGVAF